MYLIFFVTKEPADRPKSFINIKRYKGTMSVVQEIIFP